MLKSFLGLSYMKDSKSENNWRLFSNTKELKKGLKNIKGSYLVKLSLVMNNSKKWSSKLVLAAKDRTRPFHPPPPPRKKTIMFLKNQI